MLRTGTYQEGVTWFFWTPHTFLSMCDKVGIIVYGGTIIGLLLLQSILFFFFFGHFTLQLFFWQSKSAYYCYLLFADFRIY